MSLRPDNAEDTSTRSTWSRSAAEAAGLRVFIETMKGSIGRLLVHVQHQILDKGDSISGVQGVSERLDHGERR